MGMELSLGDILKDVRAASANIDAYNSETGQRIAAVEKSVNELYLKANRPGGFGGGDRESDVERKDSAELCRIKHDLATPKNDGISAEYMPSLSEIDEALAANKAMRGLFRHGNLDHLDNIQKKSLTGLCIRLEPVRLGAAVVGLGVVVSCRSDRRRRSDGAGDHVGRLVEIFHRQSKNASRRLGVRGELLLE